MFGRGYVWDAYWRTLGLAGNGDGHDHVRLTAFPAAFRAGIPGK